MKKISYITVVGVIAFGAIAYLIWQKQKEKAKAEADKKKQQQQQTTGGTTTTTTANTGSGAGSTGGSTTANIKMFTTAESAQYLIKGASGDQVKALQSFLNDNSNTNAGLLTIDGQFGQATENALNSQFGRVSISLDMLNIAGIDLQTNQFITGWGSGPLFNIVFD